MEIYKKDISKLKEFKVNGNRLVFQEITDEGWYIYSRWFDDGHLMGYEVVKPIKSKNPDGTIVYVYPSTSHFGIYGLYFPKWMTKEDILKRCRIEWSEKSK